MCGIAGEVRWDGGAADVPAVARMTAALSRRGPDASGVWASGPVALGHRRLSIIDRSPQGSQPMVDPVLGLTLVFNGCIYNYRELREELRRAGHRFFSDSDTEVVLRGYAEWGTDVVDRLVGMFAFCVHERDAGRTVLVRDRLGIKPLYLTTGDRRLRFASSLPALLTGGGISGDLDPVALHHYLTLHGIVPGSATVLRDVRKLAPATVMTVQPDGTTLTRTYWDPPWERRPEDRSMTDADWEDAVLDALRRAVERRLVADVPVGVLLSGGLDSSLITALVAERSSDPVRTFSIGFDAVGGEPGDEFAYSDLVASTFGTQHQRLRVPTEDVVSAVHGAVEGMSEPMLSHDVVAFYMLSRVVAEHVKVVQSGQGADEVLAGYYWHQPFADVPRDLAPSVFAREFFDRPHAALAEVLEPAWLLDHDPSTALVEADMARPGAQTALDAVQRLDVGRLMPDDPVKRVDNMTMSWGLEARVPFLDHELVELVARCPAGPKLSDGGKGLLKAIGRRLLPAEVVDRPKGYFPLPALRSIDGDALRLAREALCSPEARARGLLRSSHVEQLLAEPQGHRGRGGASLLWQLAVLELWLQHHTAAPSTSHWEQHQADDGAQVLTSTG